MSLESKNWSSELLSIFGMWLWGKGEHGHALLSIHGPIWGYKIGAQLNITWNDVIRKPNSTNLKTHFDVLSDKLDSSTARSISGVGGKYLEKALSLLEIKNLDDSIYMNYKKEKPLTTSTLNRELQKFSEEFIKELETKIDYCLRLKPLKSSAFQIAWALKTLERYNYSKKCFIEVSKYMGHRTLKDTIKILGVEPYDNIIFDFSGAPYSANIDSSLLENDSLLKYYTGYAMDI